MIDLILLILTIYLEAECQSFEGKQAVANVIYNRSVNVNKTIVEVVLKPRQFSCWNDTIYVQKRLKNINIAQIIQSTKAALLFWDDITGGATHYTTIRTKKQWMKNKIITRIIGKHKFMKRK
jgi:spore germination cell wall hydrolase CwlJ-like protein